MSKFPGFLARYLPPYKLEAATSVFRVKRLVAGEAALGVVVLASVGVLTSLEPARQVAAREGIGVSDSLTFQDTVEGAAITLEIEPATVGPNTFTVSLEDRLGNPIATASDVALRLAYLDADLGEETASAMSMGDGTYVLSQSMLSIAGAWQVELIVRLSQKSVLSPRCRLVRER